MDPQSAKAASARALSRLLGCQPESLPTLPPLAMELSAITANEEATIGELVKVISRDPTLAARILKVANSPAFRTGEAVTNLERAVIRLGFREVSSLALGLSILSSAGGGRPLQRRLQQVRLWQHAIAVASLAEIIARKRLGWGTGYYIYGLLHDIGKVALDAYRPKDFAAVMELVGKEGIPWIEAENQVIMADHGFVAMVMLDYWGLPKTLVDAVGNHHWPWKAGANKEQAGLVFVADCLAKHFGLQAFDKEEEFSLDQLKEDEAGQFLKERGWALEDLVPASLKDDLDEMLENLGSLDG